MIPDLVFLWSLFSDVYQILGGPAPFADLVKTHPDLLSDIRVIVEGDSPAKDCSFWQFPNGQVSVHDATGQDLKDVLKTLRNGFAHSHWLHADLSAADYWTALGWDVASPDPGFNLQGRPKNNYTIYIADAAAKWAPRTFWSQKDLRILVTHSAHLRYYLHLLLNYILNGSRENVFQSPHTHKAH
jgi:hypothetical protein